MAVTRLLLPAGARAALLLSVFKLQCAEPKTLSKTKLLTLKSNNSVSISIEAWCSIRYDSHRRDSKIRFEQFDFSLCIDIRGWARSWAGKTGILEGFYVKEINVKLVMWQKRRGQPRHANKDKTEECVSRGKVEDAKWRPSFPFFGAFRKWKV